MAWKDIRIFMKKAWHFIWEEDSVLSWIVNIVLAFILIKFVVYPLLGLLLSTTHPIVAVVSNSMEHETGFDNWWQAHYMYYDGLNISNSEFTAFPMKNGFNKGDIIILAGTKPKDIKIGQIVVFQSGRPDPIIHRVVRKWNEGGVYFFQTRGDHNTISIVDATLDETRVNQAQVIGRAMVRVPYLGYVKIWAVSIVSFIVGR